MNASKATYIPNGWSVVENTISINKPSHSSTRRKTMIDCVDSGAYAKLI